MNRFPFCVRRLFECVCLAILTPCAAQADDLADIRAALAQYDKQFAAGHYREAEASAKRMLSIVERASPNLSVGGALCLERLAVAYHYQGRYSPRVRWNRRA